MHRLSVKNNKKVLNSQKKLISFDKRYMILMRTVIFNSSIRELKHGPKVNLRKSLPDFKTIRLC